MTFGRAPALVEHGVAAAGAERADHGPGQLAHAGGQRLPGLVFKDHLFCHSGFLLLLAYLSHTNLLAKSFNPDHRRPQCLIKPKPPSPLAPRLNEWFYNVHATNGSRERFVPVKCKRCANRCNKTRNLLQRNALSRYV